MVAGFHLRAEGGIGVVVARCPTESGLKPWCESGVLNYFPGGLLSTSVFPLGGRVRIARFRPEGGG